MKKGILVLWVMFFSFTALLSSAETKIVTSKIEMESDYISTEQRYNSRQNLELDAGWNLLSLNVEPNSWSIDSLFAQQIDNGTLLQLKNENKSYIPDLNPCLNTITQLTDSGGYAVLMDASGSIDITGNSIDPALTPILLNEGWNLAGYTPQVSMTPEEAFAYLIDAGILEKVQSETESFDPDLLPVFNTLDLMEPGKAYWIQVNSDVEFYYPSENRNGSIRNTREIFPRPWNTVFYPSSTIAYCFVTINGEDASEGDEVGAFIDGECRGVGQVFIMNDHATTFFSIQGQTVETVHFNVWDASHDEVLDVEYTTQTNPGGDIGYPPNQLPIDAIGTGVETWHPHILKHSTTLLGRVVINGESAETGDILGAFVDAECRGYQEVINCEGTGYVTMLVQGEISETVNFKVWDASEDIVYDLENELISDPDEVFGYPPEYLSFYHGDIDFTFDLPESISFVTGDSLEIDISEFVDWLFLDELVLSANENSNILTEIENLTVKLYVEGGWSGCEILQFEVTNLISGESLTDEMEVNVTPTGEVIITNIEDVPVDQGGWVNIQFTASFYDDGDNQEEELYRIFRWQNEEWQDLTVLPATGEDNYDIAVETLTDSVEGDNAIYSYVVESEMFEGSWLSETAEGYSVDNLAPAAPDGLDFAAGYFIWSPSTEEDFAQYQVYKDDQFWLATEDTLLDMTGVLGEMSLEAIDIHGNISNRSVEIYGGFIYGDVDHDLQVTSFDGSLTLQYFCLLNPQYVPLPWEEWRILLADVDGNSSIEAYDTALILRYNLGIITEFPVENRITENIPIEIPTIGGK